MKAYKVIIESVAFSKEGAVKLAQNAAAALPGEMSGSWAHGCIESKIIEADVPDDDGDETDPPFGHHIPHPVTAAEAEA